MDRPTNVTVRADLTQYAFGLMQDVKEAMEIIQMLSPVVPTGGTSGLYNEFDGTQAFKEYAEAQIRRAIGGQATEIGLLSSTANYNVHPNGLRIKIDEFERKQAAEGNMVLLEQSKTRTLTINSVVSQLAHIITKTRAAVSATAGAGAWNEANVDPIAELNAAIKAVWLATGVVPNKCAIDFGAWCVMSGNKNILERMPGADIAAVNPGRIKSMLVNPDIDIRIVKTAGLTGGGLGNAAATKRGSLQGSAFVFYNSDMATPYDPSFCKTFSPSGTLFTDVYTYREEPHFDWYENNWESDTQIVSASLCKRIDVTGASS